MCVPLLGVFIRLYFGCSSLLTDACPCWRPDAPHTPPVYPHIRTQNSTSEIKCPARSPVKRDVRVQCQVQGRTVLNSLHMLHHSCRALFHQRPTHLSTRRPWTGKLLGAASLIPSQSFSTLTHIFSAFSLFFHIDACPSLWSLCAIHLPIPWSYHKSTPTHLCFNPSSPCVQTTSKLVNLLGHPPRSTSHTVITAPIHYRHSSLLSNIYSRIHSIFFYVSLWPPYTSQPILLSWNTTTWNSPSLILASTPKVLPLITTNNAPNTLRHSFTM